MQFAMIIHFERDVGLKNKNQTTYYKIVDIVEDFAKKDT